MNSFTDDGDFLERFKAMQKRNAVAPPASTPILSHPVGAPTTECDTIAGMPKNKSNASLPFANDGSFMSRFKDMKRKTPPEADNRSYGGNSGTVKSFQRPYATQKFAIVKGQSGALKKPAPVSSDAEGSSPAYVDVKKPAVKLEPCSGQEDFTNSTCSDDTQTGAPPVRRKRKSRWDTDGTGAKQTALSSVPPPAVTLGAVAGPSGQTPEAQEFGFSAPGSSEEQTRKQMLEQAQLKIIQERIMAKRAAMKAREQAVLMGKGKPVFEYDSDEETEGGTWEHKLRMMEMERTKDKSEKLTEEASGKHHISEFLPPEELHKFMSTYTAAKNGVELDKSEYQDAKLTGENKGFKLLQKMGWTEGKGLGATGQGITAPINKGRSFGDSEGLGASSSNEVSNEDDIYDVYRKRMMLSYRFRPNPLNNPRRPYY